MIERARSTGIDLVEHFFGSPRFTAAMAHAIIGSQLASYLLQQLIGWPGLLGIDSTLVVFAAVSLLARRRSLEWNGLLPISLLLFAGWALASVIWSQYQWVTLGSVLYLLAIGMLGIYIAIVRDTIQIARAFGNALRAALVLSLLLEIFSGVLIDTPIPLFGIKGHLDVLGPIQGIFGDRNTLGVVSLIAIVTFGTEFRTKSVRRGLGIGSLIIAFLMLLLSRSPVAIGGLVVVALAAAALYGLRRTRPEATRFWQFGLLFAAIVVAAIAWAVRGPIIAIFSATGEVSTRLKLWGQMRTLIPFHELEGWGWIGYWRPEVPPFDAFTDYAQGPKSGLNAYLDVWFQLGLIGLALFLVLVGLAFVRSWILASRQRSFVYAWPALVLVALIVTSLAESSILLEFGWLTFVVCSVKAARELSWRRAFAEPLRQPTLP